MIRSELRRSHKLRRCGCGAVILPGDQYLSCVASPQHEDLSNPHWWRLDECRGCATRYGRWPIPNGAVQP